MARRELDRARLERLAAVDRRAAVEKKHEMVEQGIDRYDQLIKQFRESPYIGAIEREVTVAFVPYQNLENIYPGVEIYGCTLSLLLCSKVGEVVSALDGEVTNTHPQDGAAERGLFLEITLSEPWASKERALFAGSRPFWIF
jgi:hypothetical protein